MTVLSAEFRSQALLGNDFLATRVTGFAVVTAAACWFASRVPANAANSNPVLDAIALTGVAIAMWHGAYDGVLAEPVFKPRMGKWWAPVFFTGYLLLVGAILVAWHFAPRCALVAFLAYSSWHFGTEQDVEPLTPVRGVAAFAMGALPIAAACHWHAEQVSNIFGFMLGPAAGSSFPEQLTRVSGELLWVCVAAAVGGSLLPRGRAHVTRLSVPCLVALELVLFRCCDPLVAFAVYFCVWHTPEHLVSSSIDGAGRYSAGVMTQNLRAGMVPWLVSLVGLAVLLVFQPKSLIGYASAIFVLLSALTVPHMALNELRRTGFSRLVATLLAQR